MNRTLGTIEMNEDGETKIVWSEGFAGEQLEAQTVIVQAVQERALAKQAELIDEAFDQR
jgi:hypothetical protein